MDPAARPGRLADRRGELRPAAGPRGPAPTTTARRGARRVAYRILRLKLPAPDTPTGPATSPSSAARSVQYVLVSSRVYDRVRAAPEDYPSIVAFYDQLGEKADLVKEFRPDPANAGRCCVSTV